MTDNIALMDKWYAGRVNKFYSEELERNVIKTVYRHLQGSHLESYIQLIPMFFSKDAFLDTARIHYSNRLSDSMRFFEMLGKDLTLARQYVIAYDKFLEFLDNVETSVDSAFIKTFGSHEGLTAYELVSGDATLKLYRALDPFKAKLELCEDMWYATKDLVPKMNEALFGDIE